MCDKQLDIMQANNAGERIMLSLKDSNLRSILQCAPGFECELNTAAQYASTTSAMGQCKIVLPMPKSDKEQNNKYQVYITGIRPSDYDAPLALLVRLTQAENSLDFRFRRLAEDFEAVQKELRTQRNLANQDPLTNLSNRRYFLSVARYAFERRAKNERSIFMLMVDIDHFKSINDRLGHEAGDDVLVALSRVMKQSIRPEDTACRWGGEEFLIMLVDVDETTAHCIAERIRKNIEECQITIRNDVISVTVSVGLTQHRNGETMENVINRSDEALFAVKSSSRNAVQLLD